MRWTVMAALVMSACASSSSGSAVSDPTPAASVSGSTRSSDAASSPVVTEPTGARPVGFETTAARATAPDGAVCEFCVWLADTAPRRSQGLMFVTDLGPADAMAFRYPDPHTGTFWMKNTLLALSIAFFDPDGGFLTSFDMEPCTSDPCPSYRTADDFVVAVEAPRGTLAELGLVDGSTFELLDLPCTP